MSGGGGGTPKATAEEKQLAQLATKGYEQANALSGGTNYLKAEATKTDRSDAYAEQSNSNAAAMIEQAVKNPLAVSSDLRTMVGGGAAAEAQADSERQRAGFSLANAGLGTTAITEKALYQQGMEQMQVSEAERAAKESKNSLIPSVLGTALGAYATTDGGQAQIKDAAGTLWDKIKGIGIEDGVAPSATFTGSHSLFRQ